MCLTTGPPEIIDAPVDVEVTEGSTLRLRCAVHPGARPFTSVWWLHNTAPVVTSELVHITGKQDQMEVL